jgi:hypothetical protein
LAIPSEVLVIFLVPDVRVAVHVPPSSTMPSTKARTSDELALVIIGVALILPELVVGALDPLVRSFLWLVASCCSWAVDGLRFTYAPLEVVEIFFGW